MMFRRLNRENEDINVEYTKISTLLNIMVTLFVESVICVILGYGGYLVYCGSFDAGQLVEYIGYFSAVVWPIMAVSMLIEKTSRGKASLNRITELLDAKVDVKDRGGVQDLPSIHGKIEFRNLTFRYPDGEYDVLKTYRLPLSRARVSASSERPVPEKRPSSICCSAPTTCRTERCSLMTTMSTPFHPHRA